MLSTKKKLQIARLLNFAIVGTRSALALAPVVDATRRGVNWRLDLNEGIELAIYLGLYQRIPARILETFVKPGAFVIDIGANIGAHSIPIAERVGEEGRVLAVEPTDYAFSRLAENVKLNPRLQDRLVLVQAALTDGAAVEANTAFFSRWPLHGDRENRHTKHFGELESASRARFTTLDALLDELHTGARFDRKVSFMKLDVDGHELDVLRGAQRFFARERPVMLIEIAPYVQDEISRRLEALVDLLRSMGYHLENSASGKALPMSAQGLRSVIPEGAGIDAIARIP